MNAMDTVHSRCSKQWMQYLHSGCSGHSGIMVYGGGDIVFGAKRSNWGMQWMQYAVDTVRSGHSGIVVYGGRTLSLVQKGQTSGCSGCSMQWMQYTVDTVE